MCHNTNCSAKEETLFLRKIFDWGKFSVNTRQLYFHCRCQELGLGKGTLLSEEFMEIATDWIKCGYNCL